MNLSAVIRWLGNHKWKTFLLSLVISLVALLIAIPSYAYYQWNSALHELKSDRPEIAADHLEFCLRIWPNSIPVHLYAARAARLQNDIATAEKHLQKCIALNHGATADVQLEYLMLRAQTGEVDQVASSLFAVVESEHKDSELILETISRAFMQSLRYGPAYSCLNRWLEYNPKSAKAHHWRGWVLERVNNPELAMKDYKKALELDPDNVRIRLRIGEMLLHDKMPQEALEYLEVLHKENPEDHIIQARLGQCYYLQGKSQEARRLLETAKENLPNDALVFQYLAKLELQEGDPEKAEEYLRQSMKIDPGDTDTQYTLVNALQAQGRRDEAEKALAAYKTHKALLERANDLLVEEATSPSNQPDGPHEVGDALLKMGHDKLGLFWLEKALERDPSHVPTHRILAEFYAANGQSQLSAHHRQWITNKEQKPVDQRTK